MELIKISCPVCNQQTILKQSCHNCSTDLRSTSNLYNIAVTYYNNAINQIKNKSIDEAWVSINKALTIFPYSPEILLLGYTIACEIGSFNKAYAILKELSTYLSEADYSEALLKLEEEIDLYNDLLENQGVVLDSVKSRLIHDYLYFIKTGQCSDRLRLWIDDEQHRELPKQKSKCSIIYRYSAAILIAVIVFAYTSQQLNVVKYKQTISGLNKSLRDYENKSVVQDQHYQETLMNIQNKLLLAETRLLFSQGSYEEISRIIYKKPTLFGYLDDKEMSKLVFNLYYLREYDTLVKLDYDSWYIPSAKYHSIMDFYRKEEKRDFVSNQSIVDLHHWIEAYVDFPSHYGDACLTLIKYYTRSDSYDEKHLIQTANMLQRWLDTMPQTVEYQQYKNNNVRRWLK